MGSSPSTSLGREVSPQMGQDNSKQGGSGGDMDRSRKEMEASMARLRSQLEKKDLEIQKLSKTAESTLRGYDDLKAKMKTLATTPSAQDGEETIQDEIKRLKIKIIDLEGIMMTRDAEIEELQRRLQKMRRDKDNQVEVVKETVEKVIKDKDVEIRRLKALWGSGNDPGEIDSNTKIGAPTKARFGITAEKRTSRSLENDVKHFPKTDAEKKSILRALRRNIFLSSLSHTQVTELIGCMQKEELNASSNIIKEGDAGTHLYVIESGEVDVFKEKENQRLAILTPGCVFGELAILYNCKRTASVRARTDVVLWSLDRLSFQSVVQRRGRMLRKEYIKLLKTVDQLHHLPEEKTMRIADCLEEESFKAGDFIIRQGESGDTFYILYEGKVKVTKYEENAQDGDEATFLSYMDRGSFFGERALLREEKRAANVIAHTDVICLTLDRLAFSSLIGDIREVQLTAPSQELLDKKLADDIIEVDEGGKDDETKVISNREKAIIQATSLEKLKVTKLLGKGGFGSVSLTHIAKIPDRAFALKKIKKAFIVKTGQEQHVITERNILITINSPFIARLHRTYKDKFNIYMLLDAYLGGDMYHHMKKLGSLDEESAKFVVACVVEALAYLHFRCIAYRDLKPENLMIDQNGYVKLVDFGFAKKVNPGNKTWTFCGTPEYFPPEILQNLGHDFSADYWSLGILTFEMLTSTTPFYAPDDMSVYEKIVDGIERIRFPSAVSKNSELLIRNLCRLEPNNRLGSMSGGVNGIRKHRWFRGFFWEGLRRQLIKSPIRVSINGTADTSNFEASLSESDDANEEALNTSDWDVHF